ncbi:DUF5681 domain-containing protein [Spirosoma foliorum]|uniref:DUF5681 domain-containing protein n=1 Tax=Spirosoma foliorum TaxID=2710596 RepID=A0A7G5H5J2_9BACT|nr:DUF5681 domain-containing protein [Spirosoma foliorum]QMW06384.1 hypothetical protein H3H32_16575 [Spirosoma foliorum]
MPIPNQELNQFKPGQSGNPGGRPKGPITQFLRELGDSDELEITLVKTKNGERGDPVKSTLSTNGEQTINQFIAARLLQMAMGGDIKAIKEVLNRTEGRVPQPIKLGGDANNPLGVMLMLPENGRLDPPPSNIPPAQEPNE